MKTFDKSFTQQEPLPLESIAAANTVMQSGRLHRYNTLPGEPSEVDLLEQEFASYMGKPYCLACASGGYALQLALRAAGVTAGDLVLSNAFTLAPVPGAIDACGATPVFVNVDDNYCIDIEHLAAQADSSGAGFLMLSHMRGHIANMDKIMAVCKSYNLTLIEDCAHTMGASWNDAKSGSLADVACYSTQTYKHINAGEGGLLISADPTIAVRAIILSGSYMFFENHVAAPPASAFDSLKLTTPNHSGRMDNLRAAILRPQLAKLDDQCQRWNQRYRVLETQLRQNKHIVIPQRDPREQFVASSIQFSLPEASAAQIRRLLEMAAQRGVVLKWFGDDQPKGYTSRFDSWQYLTQLPALEQTQRVLASLLDMRIPLTFNLDDCRLIADIIIETIDALAIGVD